MMALLARLAGRAPQCGITTAKATGDAVHTRALVVADVATSGAPTALGELAGVRDAPSGTQGAGCGRPSRRSAGAAPAALSGAGVRGVRHRWARSARLRAGGCREVPGLARHAYGAGRGTGLACGAGHALAADATPARVARRAKQRRLVRRVAIRAGWTALEAPRVALNNPTAGLAGR